jgi:hypothetical protein
MRTAAAAAAASHRARDWREQSHADGRRRHAEYDAQSPRDHCRPRCRRQIQSPQPNWPRFGRRRPSQLCFKGTITASAYHTHDRAFLFARSAIEPFAMHNARAGVSRLAKGRTKKIVSEGV